jgi:transcriptional regulator with XRE-family HTH domain
MRIGDDNIADVIRRARVAHGLTQKQLGERTGIPQSHISKIEKGGVDIKLSSLTEIGRALELEIQLVPRRALSAVEGSLRVAETLEKNNRARALLNREKRIADRIHSEYPDLPDSWSYFEIIRDLLRIGIDPQDIALLEATLKPARKLEAVLETYDRAAIGKQLTTATTTLRAFRNAQAHKVIEAGSPVRAAYRLEDEAP